MSKTSIPISKILPQWSKRVATELGGRDPLGLSRVSSTITDYLLTGIITTTYRARYYSFYCWVLWHIQNEGEVHRFQDFVDGFRRLEAMVALSTIANSYKSSAVGSEAAHNELSMAKERDEVKSDFRVLPSNPLGGYGQYYSGCLYGLRLTYRPEDGVDRITEGIAQQLAQCFNENIKKTTYIQKKLFKNTFITLKELGESKTFFTLDALSTSFANNEREKIIELFFGLHETNPSETTLLRRQTLSHILNIIFEYQNRGFKINLETKREDFPIFRRNERLDWYLLYLPYYYDVLWPQSGDIHPYAEPKYFDITHSLWKQFCLQEFLTQGIEYILTGILGVLSTESLGLNLEEIVRRALKEDFETFFQENIKQNCSSPSELMSAIGMSEIPDEKLSKYLQKELNISHEFSEANIINYKENAPGALIAKGFLLLAVLYGKWRSENTDPGFLYVSKHAGAELWIGRILPYLDLWFDKQYSWKEAIEVFTNDFILDQHDRVMYEKRNMESCWLHRNEGKIFKDQDYSPRWRSSRHNNAFNILQDLCLIGINQDNFITLSAEGEKILKSILK